MLDGNEIDIEGHLIGFDHSPFIVAEISANHGQSYEKAIQLIHAAKKAGADAVKFQAYTPESMTVDSEKEAYQHSDTSLWKDLSLYRLYKKAYTPHEWFKPLFEEARKLDIIAFSSVFDQESVELMEECDVPCYKIASLELVDHPLLKIVAETQKPIILSTGACTLEEIEEAVEVIFSTGNEQVVLLKCVSAYPAPIQESNLITIPDMIRRFEVPIGLSDHTVTPLTSLLSVALGASMIEKHFILSRKEKMLDAAFSLEPEEMATLVREARLAFLARGVVHYGPTLHEKDNFKFRRSLICVKDIAKGETITLENVKPLRPGIGLAPKYLDSVLGQKGEDLSKERGSDHLGSTFLIASIRFSS